MNSKVHLINEKMQIGYKYYRKNKIRECSNIWYETWCLIKEIMCEYKIQSINDFDKAFNLVELLFNWASDFQETLQNVMDYEICINFCEWLIPLYREGEINKTVAKIAIAESHFNLNNKEIGEKKYQELTEKHPEYVWGWINWSDQYWLFNESEKKDYKKGEEILLKALNIKNIDDKMSIYERLLDLYEETGESAKYKDIQKKLEKINKFSINNNSIILNGEKALEEGNFQENVPYGFGLYSDTDQSDKVKKKIGRNDPCPCGSGKKYKKCCLNL
jgi:uncharacterized protein YecA (UPF0149 family)